MIEAPKPPDEEGRLASLAQHCILDTPPEPAFDDLALLASRLAATPIALVCFVDESRQWFKASVGLTARETPRRGAFCAHAILDSTHVMKVPDARLDPRFADSPIVTGAPHVVFYCGVPLVASDGHVLGTLCVIDHVPRELAAVQVESLQALARQAVSLLELRLACSRLEGLSNTLAVSNRDLDDFACLASHDLKEPLNGIRNYAQLIADETDLTPEELAQRLGVIVRLSRRAAALLDDLFHSARLGRTEYAEREVSLGDVAREAIDCLELFLDQAGARVLVAPDLPSVACDPGKVREVFLNLITNAVKYNDRDEKLIEIGWEPRSPPVFFVKDDGIGIEPKHHERVFQIFQRLHGRDQYGGGTGAGLSFVRRIVERHGGEIGITSDVGVGSTFRFTLAKSPAGALRHGTLAGTGTGDPGRPTGR